MPIPLIPPVQGPGGLFAAAAPPQEKPKRNPSFLDRILGLYGADPSSHIPQEQRGRAIGEGLMQGGIAMLGAPPGTSTGEALAAGLQGMRGGAQQYGAQLRAGDLRDKLQSMVESGASPAQLQAVMMELIARGGEENLKAAQMLAQIISAMQGREGVSKPQVVSPGQVMVDPTTGRPIYENTNPTANQANPQLKTVYNPNTQRYEYETYDPASRQWTPTGRVARPNIGAGQPTELERRADFFLPMAMQAEDIVNSFEGSPTRLQQLTEASSINEMQSPEAQQLYTAGRIMGDAYLRITSGAAIKDEEVDMFIRSFLPYPGDSKAVLATKRQMRTLMLNGLKKLGQRANGGQIFGSSSEALSEEGIDRVLQIGDEEGDSSDLPPIEDFMEKEIGG